MADNVEAASGSGGATFKTDEDTGASAHVPVTKIELGANNSFDGYVSTSNPMPCAGPAAENAAVAGNPLLAGGRYDSTPRTLGDGDVGAMALDADGAVHISDGGNAITVDQSTAANLNCTEASAADIKTAVELIDDTVATDDTSTHTAATTKVLGIGAVATPTDTNVDANDIGMPAMSVDRRLHTDSQIVGQDAALDVSAATVTVDLGANNDVQGDVAHDAADSGNPVKIGAKVETSPKGITAAADGDRTDLYADSDGMLLVKVGTTGADLVSERVSDTGGTSTAFTNFSAVASTYNYVTAISIANTSATDGYVDIRDGTAGSVLWTVPIPANGGVTIANAGCPLFKSTANTALAYDVSAALTTVYISMSGYQSKV